MSTIASRAPVTSNQRSLDRVSTFVEGQILIGNSKPIECIVWDMTERGAKIGITAAISLPLYFDLYMSEHDLRLRCEGRWRAGEFVGVRFRLR